MKSLTIFNFIKVSILALAMLVLSLPAVTRAAEDPCPPAKNVSGYFDIATGKYNVKWDKADDLQGRVTSYYVKATCRCGDGQNATTKEYNISANGQAKYGAVMATPCKEFAPNPYVKIKNCGECTFEVTASCEAGEAECGTIDSCEPLPDGKGACNKGTVVLGSYFADVDAVDACPTSCNWQCQSGSSIKDCRHTDEFTCGPTNNTFVKPPFTVGSAVQCLKNGKPAQQCLYGGYNRKDRFDIEYFWWGCGTKLVNKCRTCFLPACNESDTKVSDETFVSGNYKICERGFISSYSAVVSRKTGNGTIEKVLAMTDRSSQPIGFDPLTDTIIRWTMVCRGSTECTTASNPNPPEVTCTILRGYCGDNQVQSNEECDDGKNDGSGFCNSDCRFTSCGDGKVQIKPSNGKGWWSDKWTSLSEAKANRFTEECDEGDNKGNINNGANSNDCPNTTKFKCNEPKDGKGGTIEPFGICKSCQCEEGPVTNIRCMKACAAPGQKVAESPLDCDQTKDYFDPVSCSCKPCDEDCSKPVDEKCRGTEIVTGERKCNQDTHKCDLIEKVRQDCKPYPENFGYTLYTNSSDPKWGRDAQVGYLKCAIPKTLIGTGKCVRDLNSHVPGAKMKCELSEEKKCLPFECNAKCADGEIDPDTYIFDINGISKKATIKDERFCYESTSGKCDDATCAFTKPVQTEFCGDTKVQQPCEACDDGNRDDGDGCSKNCTLECGEGNKQRMNETKWQEAIKNSPTWLCGDGKQPSKVICKDAKGNDLENCQPVNEIVERHWTCTGDVKCISYNAGCAYPNEAYLTGELTPSSAAEKNFDKLFMRESGCLMPTTPNNYQAVLGNNGKDWADPQCANLFCYNKEIPFNIKYNPWSTTNLNPTWTWSCPSDGDLQGAETCQALEMACAPKVFQYANKRHLDSFVSDATTDTASYVLGQAIEDDRKMTRDHLIALNKSNHLCFNGGTFVPASEIRDNRNNDAKYGSSEVDGYYGYDLFKYDPYQRINDNQGRWLWTCQYGDDIKSAKASYPNYDTFTGDVLNINHELDSSMYCSFDELAKCKYDYETAPKLSKKEILANLAPASKGLNTLCAQSYVDTNIGNALPDSENGLKFVRDGATGDNSVFYFCASDYKTNSCWQPVKQGDGTWAIEKDANCALTKAYQDPLCRVKVKGCQNPPNGKTDYTISDFYSDKEMGVCFDKNGQYSANEACRQKLCEDDLEVSDFEKTLVNGKVAWTWNCDGDTCQAGSVCAEELAINEVIIEEPKSDFCADDEVKFEAKVFVGTCDAKDVKWTFEVYDKSGSGNLVSPEIGTQKDNVYTIKMDKKYAGYELRVRAVCESDCSRQTSAEATATMDFPEIKDPKATVSIIDGTDKCVDQRMTLIGAMTGCKDSEEVGFEKQLNGGVWEDATDIDIAPGFQVAEDTAGDWQYRSIMECLDCTPSKTVTSEDFVKVTIASKHAVSVTVSQEPSGSFCAGSPAILKAVGAGCQGDESYEWRGSYGNLVSRTAEYMLKNHPAGKWTFEGIYSCKNDPCADPSIDKASIEVTVKDKPAEPTITRQPKNQLDKCQKDIEDLVGDADCQSPEEVKTYQWQVYNEKSGNREAIPGATSNTLSKPGPGSYYLSITCENECGNWSRLTEEAIVSIKAGPAKPDNTSVSLPLTCKTMEEELDISASGTCVGSDIKYQWYYSTDDVNYDKYVETKTLPKLMPSGYYKVIISCVDDCGVSSTEVEKKTSVQRVAKPSAPTVTIPDDITCRGSEDIDFKGTVTCDTGDPALYQWYYNATDQNGVYTKVIGANTNILNPQMVSGYYKLEAYCQNDCNMTSESATMSDSSLIERVPVPGKPENVKLEGNYKCLGLNEEVSMTTPATCKTGDAIYEWLHLVNGSYEPYDVANKTNTLKKLAEAGFYKVMVSCKHTRCDKTSEKVTSDPAVELHRFGLTDSNAGTLSASRNNVCAGLDTSKVTLTPKYDGECKGGDLSYEWYFALAGNPTDEHTLKDAKPTFDYSLDSGGVLTVFSVTDNLLFKYKAVCSSVANSCTKKESGFSNSVRIDTAECGCGDADKGHFTNSYFNDFAKLGNASKPFLCKGSITNKVNYANGVWSWSCMDGTEEIAKCSASEVSCGSANGKTYTDAKWDSKDLSSLCVNTRSGKSHKGYAGTAPIDMTGINDFDDGKNYDYKSFSNVDTLLDEGGNRTTGVDMEAKRNWFCYGDGDSSDVVTCASDILSCGPADAEQLIDKAKGVNVVVPKTTFDGSRYHGSYASAVELKDNNKQHLCVQGMGDAGFETFAETGRGNFTWKCKAQNDNELAQVLDCSARQDCGWASKSGDTSNCGNGANNDSANSKCYPTVKYNYGGGTCWTAKNVQEKVNNQSTMYAWEAYNMSYDAWDDTGFNQGALADVTTGSCPTGFIVPTMNQWHSLESYLDDNADCALNRTASASWACAPAGQDQSNLGSGLKSPVTFNGLGAENYWTKSKSCTPSFRGNMYNVYASDINTYCFGTYIPQWEYYCKATPIFYGLNDSDAIKKTQVNQDVNVFSSTASEKCYNSTDNSVKHQLRCVNGSALGARKPPSVNPGCIGVGCFRFR